jgi:hypothetical protein
MIKHYIPLTESARLGPQYVREVEGMGAKTDQALGGKTLRIELGDASPERVRDVIEQLLEFAGLSHDESVEVLGGALVSEAVRPHWYETTSPAEAHAELRDDDPALADAIEALAPLLYGRAAVRTVEGLLGLR